MIAPLNHRPAIEGRVETLLAVTAWGRQVPNIPRYQWLVNNIRG